MARTKKTYIVNDRWGRSHTLRDWCEEHGLNYNTVLARIWRSEPEIVSGVIYFDYNDPILDDRHQPEGAGAHGNGHAVPPRKQPRKYNVKHGDVHKGNRLK